MSEANIGLGPEAEQIVGGSRTYRVAIEREDGTKDTIAGFELMRYRDAHGAATTLWLARYQYKPNCVALCVVDEGTGFTTDRLTRG